MSQATILTLLALLWLLYFASHSWLASLRTKHWVARRHPALMPWYRLLFNGLALVLVLPPLGLMFYAGGEPLWEWRGITAWIAYGLMLLAVIGFFWSLRFYDGGEFLGLRQLRHRIHEVHDQERLHISPLHRHVRHPWYSLGLVLVWTQEMDPARLVSAIAITLYFLYGSRLEERKLLVYHGERYREYQRRVPGLVPRPWRNLSREEAERIMGS
jgi:protein-S-isoprenylcysteine O-methyltransferase Ste14